MDEPSSTITPSQVERAFQQREAWAFEEAYAMHRRLLYSAAYGVLHDRDDAEDCVHDVLLRLWKRGHSYTTARGSLQSFLAVCVRNEALSRRRKAQNRKRIDQENLVSEASEATFENELAQREWLGAAMHLLSEDQRKAIALAYFEGLTHVEIASRLQQPLGTIKSRLSTSLRLLRGELA